MSHRRVDGGESESRATKVKRFVFGSLLWNKNRFGFLLEPINQNRREIRVVKSGLWLWCGDYAIATHGNDFREE